MTSVGTAEESPDEKACYTRSFVVLAASSASVAGLPGARELLNEAFEAWDQRFFEPGPGCSSTPGTAASPSSATPGGQRQHAWGRSPGWLPQM